MSEILSMSSGPQGTASSSDAFDLPETGSGSEHSESGSPEAGAGHGENVPRGTNGENGNGNEPNGDGQQRVGKRNSRFERARRAREKERAELNELRQIKAQQESFRQEQARFHQERAQFEESKKPKRDYSLADLKKWLPAWKQEAEQGFDGREELVRKAEAEIAAMEAEEKASKMVVELPKRGTPDHAKMWHQGEAELQKLDPEFQRQGTKLDTKLRQILSGPHANAYLDHPQGIYAAYDRAKREVLEEDNKGLRTELSRLQKELQRYTGLTSIGGGVPGRMGEGGVASVADFARLSSSDMLKHLKARAKAGKDSTGWL